MFILMTLSEKRTPNPAPVTMAITTLMRDAQEFINSHTIIEKSRMAKNTIIGMLAKTLSVVPTKYTKYP